MKKALLFDYDESKDLRKNPYVEASDWVWQIDSLGFALYDERV